MSKEQLRRFMDRAEEERVRAHTARDPITKRACLDLAEKYEAVAKAYRRLSRSGGDDA
ncbi:MAG TPA: hypothetical protein VGC56_09890 [Allosphingosinicella sp.]|jgi:hypothetical protein